jgi:beta-N-acetylhexosaminidase
MRWLLVTLFVINSISARDIDSLYQSLSVEARLGQILMPAFSNRYQAIDDPDREAWQYAIDSLQVGGFILFGGDVLAVERLTREMQGRSRLPLLISADFENGTGSIFDNGTHFVTAMGIGAGGDPNSAYVMGAVTAIEARNLGIHMIFAPVADVNSNPDNLIISYRAYGDHPDSVSTYVEAFVRGIQSNGALAVAKHFPGHGDVDRDSHIDLIRQNKSESAWRAEELPPFNAAIAAGSGGIMTAHIAFPALSGNDLPATMSAPLLQTKLRQEMGYQGLIITDAMNMGAVTNSFWSGLAAKKALLAGADIILMPLNLRATAQYLLAEYRRGNIPEGRLREAVTRVLLAKEKLGLWRAAGPRPRPEEKVGLHRAQALADSISARGLTLSRQKSIILPLQSGSNLHLVVASDEEIGTAALADFAGHLRRHNGALRTAAIDARSNDAEFTTLLDELGEADEIIVAIKVRVRAFSGSASLPAAQMQRLRQLFERYPQSLMIVFGNPYFAREIAAENVLHPYTWSRTMQRVTAAALFGNYAIRGRLPISIPGHAPAGSGSDVPARAKKLPLGRSSLTPLIDSLVLAAIAGGTFPGAQVAVLEDDELVHLRAYGKHTYAGNAEVKLNDRYDLASLTKVLATTLMAMKLYDRGQLKLDYTVAQFYPEAGAQLAEVTLRQLLSHTSGLPAYRPFYAEFSNPQVVIPSLLQTPLHAAPGEVHKYSDLNFILLKEILEQVAGERMATYLEREFYRPLRLATLTFRPAQAIPSEVMEGKEVKAEVQDRNARLLGGIAGHAGLFANATDVSVIAAMLLNGGAFYGQRFLRPETIALFRQRQFRVAGFTHALGWDTPSPQNSLAGDLMPRNANGHWGYSGTSVWLDYERKLAIVLLTNRTYPSRENRRINQFRPLFHDAIYNHIFAAGR